MRSRCPSLWIRLIKLPLFYSLLFLFSFLLFSPPLSHQCLSLITLLLLDPFSITPSVALLASITASLQNSCVAFMMFAKPTLQICTMQGALALSGTFYWIVFFSSLSSSSSSFPPLPLWQESGV